MTISINILEVASELATLQVHERFENNGINAYTQEEDTDCLHFTELAQDVFNEWYDYYYELLESFQE